MLHGECMREIGRPADSIAIYREALEVAAAEDDRCRAWIGLAAGMRVTDDYDEAFGALDEAEALAHARSLGTELSQIHYYRGSLHFPLGNIEGCLEEHERALASAERAGSPECQARALSGLGDTYYSRGRTMTALEYFRRCIALCRTHNLTRIEVGNHYMVAWNRLYMNEIEGALEDALVAVDGAVRVGHRRAEIVARLTAGGVLTERGDLDAASEHCERGLELASTVGAERFKPFMWIFIGRIRLAKSGYQTQTVAMMKDAVETARQTGIQFLGPWVLGTLALVTDDWGEARRSLVEAESIIEQGCVGHNYFGFYRDAIAVGLHAGNATRRNATRTRSPLGWAANACPGPNFLPRADAPWRRTAAAPAIGTLADLARLKAEAERAGLLAAVPDIDRALAAFESRT